MVAWFCSEMLKGISSLTPQRVCQMYSSTRATSNAVGACRALAARPTLAPAPASSLRPTTNGLWMTRGDRGPQLCSMTAPIPLIRFMNKRVRHKCLAYLGSCSTCRCSSLSQGMMLRARPKGSGPSSGPR